MKSLEIKSKSSEETLQIAKKFAKFLNKGDVVILSGDLGAGKTKFVEGFLWYFGIQDEISSPTFNIVNEYTATLQEKLVKIYHFDLYRLEDSDEFYAIGGEEYFEAGISLIEWGEIISDVLPKEYIKITISKNETNENERTLKFEICNKDDSIKYENILRKFEEEMN